MSYINKIDINKAFKEHLINNGNYTELEAEIGSYGFPFEDEGSPFITEKYIGEENIEGFKYEKRACIYSMYELNMVSGSYLRDFMYYKYYCLEDINDGYEYSKARKLYEYENVKMEDFI